MLQNNDLNPDLNPDLNHNGDICREDGHEREEEKSGRAGINISACLEARSLYDAAYHRDRGDAVVPPPPKPHVVSLWEYLCAGGMKAGAAALGRGLQLTMLMAGALIVTNCAQNVSDYQRAQPVVHIGSPPEKYWTGQNWEFRSGYERGGLIKVVPDGEIVINADGPGTWSEVPAYKLPPGWAQANAAYYVALFGALFFSGVGAQFCLMRARRIKTGIPIQYADTAHLGAQESLVRASQEPSNASLVRAASRPDASPDTLLRPLGATRETPPEQLVRAAAGREQD